MDSVENDREANVFTEENFRKIVEYAPVGIIIIDADLKWRLVNERFCDITGYSKEELLGKTFIDITYTEDIKLNMDFYLKMLSGEIDKYEYEKRYVRKDGRIIWVHLNVSAIRVNGVYSHMVVSVQDIDESKRYQQALEAKNKELDTLFYKVSHDLKSPTTTLKGLCHLLTLDHPNLAGGQIAAHLERTIAYMQMQNQRFGWLTQINEHTPDLKPCLLTRVVANVEKQLNIWPSVVRHGNLNHSIMADNFLLTVILDTVLENMISHKSPDRELQIEISLQQEPGRNLIRMTDNGIGRDSISKAHAFEMFYKDTSATLISGLELYLARKALDKLKGDILLESEPGKGSSFSIFLPSK